MRLNYKSSSARKLDLDNLKIWPSSSSTKIDRPIPHVLKKTSLKCQETANRDPECEDGKEHADDKKREDGMEVTVGDDLDKTDAECVGDTSNPKNPMMGVTPDTTGYLLLTEWLCLVRSSRVFSLHLRGLMQPAMASAASTLAPFHFFCAANESSS